MAMQKPQKQRRFQDGGDVNEAEMKQRGLDISNRAREEGTEKTGFFQRLREGNIDDPNSVAYKKYGAGRARLDDQIETGKLKLADEVRQKVKADKASDGDVDERDRRMEAAASAPSRMPTRPGQSSSGRMTSAAPKVDATASQKAKTAAEYSDATDAMRNRSRMAANSANKKSSTTDALRAKSRREAAFAGAKRMANTPEAQAKRKAMEKGQALERVSPEEYIVGGGAGLGLKALHKMAKNLAKPKIKEYNPKMLPAPKAAPKVDTKALPAPTKRLEYDKKGALDARREARAEKNRSEMLEENAKRYGLDPKAPGYDSAAKSVQKDMGGKDFSFKKGGRVSASKMGSSSSSGAASKRADGIAQRGKTRCKVY